MSLLGIIHGARLIVQLSIEISLSTIVEIRKAVIVRGKKKARVIHEN